MSILRRKRLEEMAAWASRPLQQIYAAIFIDAIHVKVRNGQVGNQPFYTAISVDLGLWAGTGGGEPAKFWLNVALRLCGRGEAARRRAE